MTPVRVLVADDDDLMRAGLSAVLSTDATLEVVGEARDGQQAVDRARQLDPDIVLMDVRMPHLDGIEATRHIVAATTHPRVLILTTFEEEDYIFGALSAGASGFLLKRTRPEDLIAGIHVVASGEALLSPSVTRRIIDQLARQPPMDSSSVRRLRRLTPREREVVELVARGLSNAEVAAALVVEESTVKSHMKRIFAKLELRDRVQVVILGYEAGLVRPGHRTGRENSPRGA